MKKSLIAGAGVAAFGLAVLPVAGVFAETGSTSFTDNLSVEVNAGCTLENGGNTDGTYTDRSFSKTIAVGNYAVLESADTAATDNAAMTIKCNVTTGTVTVKATPANTGNLLSGTNKIEPGAQTSGSASGWAIKSNAENTTSDPYSAYKAAPTADDTFLTSQASASGTTFNPSYQVYVAQGQAVGTYTGSVTYTISYAPGA